MSITKVQRSKDAMAAVIYATYGTKQRAVDRDVRAAALSVVGPRGGDPLAWAMETRDCVDQAGNRSNECIIVIQSFDPAELDATHDVDIAKAHAAGVALAQDLAPGCDVVVATHNDTAHLHNHILIANHDRSSGLAAPKTAGNAHAVRRCNDAVMKSMGLQVLTQPEISYSRDERHAVKHGRSVDSTDLTLADLTRDTWRDFARTRVEELMSDPRVVDAVRVGTGSAPALTDPALDVMEEVAGDYGLSFFRRGSSGKHRRERSSFALLDDSGDVVRVRGHDGRGPSSRCATAGSRLGADFTLAAIRAHLLRQRQREQELELEALEELKRFNNIERTDFYATEQTPEPGTVISPRGAVVSGAENDFPIERSGEVVDGATAECRVRTNVPGEDEYRVPTGAEGRDRRLAEAALRGQIAADDLADLYGGNGGVSASHRRRSSGDGEHSVDSHAASGGYPDAERAADGSDAEPTADDLRDHESSEKSRRDSLHRARTRAGTAQAQRREREAAQREHTDLTAPDHPEGCEGNSQPDF
mgnify:CR=1 FL=1